MPSEKAPRAMECVEVDDDTGQRIPGTTRRATTKADRPKPSRDKTSSSKSSKKPARDNTTPESLPPASRPPSASKAARRVEIEEKERPEERRKSFSDGSHGSGKRRSSSRPPSAHKNLPQAKFALPKDHVSYYGVAPALPSASIDGPLSTRPRAFTAHSSHTRRPTSYSGPASSSPYGTGPPLSLSAYSHAPSAAYTPFDTSYPQSPAVQPSHTVTNTDYFAAQPARLAERFEMVGRTSSAFGMRDNPLRSRPADTLYNDDGYASAAEGPVVRTRRASIREPSKPIVHARTEDYPPRQAPTRGVTRFADPERDDHHYYRDRDRDHYRDHRHHDDYALDDGSDSEGPHALPPVLTPAISNSQGRIPPSARPGLRARAATEHSRERAPLVHYDRSQLYYQEDPPRRPLNRHSGSYDLGRGAQEYRLETANSSRPRQTQVYPDNTVSTGSSGTGYEDRLNMAKAYQNDVAGEPVRLTAELLKKQRRQAGSSRSTKSSDSRSRDESDYRRSATTRTTRSGSGDDENMTIKVTGTAHLVVGGARIEVGRDGGEIQIKRQSATIRNGSEKSNSEYGGQRRIDDRRSRIDALPSAMTRMSSTNRSRESHVRTRPAPLPYDHYGDGHQYASGYYPDGNYI